MEIATKQNEFIPYNIQPIHDHSYFQLLDRYDP